MKCSFREIYAYMLRRSCFCLIFFCFYLNIATARQLIIPNSLLTILKLKDEQEKEKKLIGYVKYVFEKDPLDHLYGIKIQTHGLLMKYNVQNKAAIDYFIESICQIRTSHHNEAEKALISAIFEACKNEDHYLLYTFYSHLAFLQTYLGNTTDAISNFGKAKKEAILLDDAYLQVLIAINISDIYYRNNFYSQSLSYLNQARLIMAKNKIREQRLINIINYNKAENFFRTNRIDSLKKYNYLLNEAKSGTNKLYYFRKRTDYYVALLQNDYKNVIKTIIALKSDTLYRYENTDDQNLADAYYRAGLPDSAKQIINRLLEDKAQNNHPEIKSHLYEVLGQIAEADHNYEQTAYNYNIALQQAKEQIGRLTQVDTISSQIKMDEMQGTYIQKEGVYKTERLWLIFMVIVAMLAIVIGALFYFSIKQKRYYEKLLFETKKEELSFINSHEVRRHLSNILGIIDTIKQSENKLQAYLQGEDHLLCAAENLDKATKSIAAKLND
ncbi:MAG: hypothetical protein JWR67_1912 [Mucilaginibacter sp.]|nr:hypothetical protein [Mucilaginibacter sp.]